MLEWKSDELRVSRGWGVIVLLLIAMTASIIAAQGAEFDLVIRNGTIYDGRGGPPVHGDVAILKDRIAAVGALQQAQATEEVDATRLAVAPGFRRQRIARQLVAAVIAQARQEDAAAIYLEVRESNAAARGLYSSFGFVESTRRPAYYRDPPEAAVVYRLAFNPELDLN